MATTAPARGLRAGPGSAAGTTGVEVTVTPPRGPGPGRPGRARRRLVEPGRAGRPSTAAAAWCGASSTTDRAGAGQPAPPPRRGRLDVGEPGRAVAPGPATSARWGSRRTSASRSGHSASATYGGFDTTRSTRPRSSVGQGRRTSRRRRSATRRPRPVARPPPPGPGWPRPRPGRRRRRRWPRPPRAAGPAPLDGEAGRWPRAGPEVDGHRPVRAPLASGASSSRATSTTCSVSGRGMSTRGSTSSSSERKAQWPSTYWRGSPASRRSARAGRGRPHGRRVDRRRRPDRRRARRRRPSGPRSASRAGRPGPSSRARLGPGRPRARPASPRRASSSPASWRARLSAISASVSSSRSPASTWSSLCRVRLTRWSVTRFSLKL